MEQSVWLYFGVIAVIIGLGVIGRTVLIHNENAKNINIENDLSLLKQKCDFVCISDEGTKLSVDIDMPSSGVLTAEENKICIMYKENLACDICECSIQDYELNLNTSLAQESFDVHRYRCSFERLETQARMECRG